MKLSTFLAFLVLGGLPLIAQVLPGTISGRQFAADPNLHATLRQTSILDVSPPDPGAVEASPEPVARYHLGSGKHTFCLDENDPYIEGMIVETAAGKVVARLSRSNRCQKALLEGGSYRMRLQRSLAAASGGAGVNAFIHANMPSVPLVDNRGVPLAGWWAMRASPEVSLDGRPGYPRLHSDILTIGGIFGNYNGRPWIIDFSDIATNPFAANSFLSFSDGANSYFAPKAYPANDMMNSVTRFFLNGNSYDLPFIDDDNSDDAYGTMRVTSNGNYRFQLIIGTSSGSLLSYGGTQFDTYGIVFQTPGGGPFATINYVETLFRFFPVGSYPTDLYPGEIHMAQSCDLGQASSATFATDQANLALLSGNVISFNNTTRYIRMGNDTAVTLYSGPNFTGTATLIKDATCLPPSTAVGSFQIQPLTPVITVGTRSCRECLLEGVDLTGQNLSGVDFTSAVFTGANLSNTVLSGATLSHANLAGVTLHCTSLNGSDSAHPVDLSTAILSNLKIVPDNSCLTNMSFTHLTLASFPATLWKLVDLTNAVIDGAANQQLSTKANPLDLSGAHLSGVSLPGVGLDYATLTNATLINTVLNGATLREVNASGVKLNGANLINANLDHANLGGAFLNPDPAASAPRANLASAFLRNVNFANAQLSSATFTSANFFSTTPVNESTCAVSNGFTQQCATASGATMNSTAFDDALLAGVDFTNTTVQGVRLGGAILIGSNFNGATISGDSKLGTDSGFTGAYLQGAALQPAASISNTSLFNSFLDFGYQGQVGNTMYLVLNGAHTSFAGYWNESNKGKNSCIELSYTKASTVPIGNTTITCPDGSAGTSTPLGCGTPSMIAANAPHWGSTIDVSSGEAPASYQFTATYTGAPNNPICSPDSLWTTPATQQP